MSVEGQVADANRQKLEMVIQKGDQIISMLEKQGINTDECRLRMKEAKDHFSSGDLGGAYKLAQHCIGDLMKLKERAGPERKDDKGSVQKKGKGVFALIRDNNVEILKKVEEWKIIVKGWRDKGYDFEKDESLFTREFEEIEKRFISIGEQIERAESIRAQLNRVRGEYSEIGSVHRNKLIEIEASVFKLDRLDDLDRRVRGVNQTFKVLKERYTNLRNRLGRYGRSGLKTRFLEEILENDEDVDYIERQFNLFDSNLEYLLKEKQKLQTFREEAVIDDFKDRIAEIEMVMDDPMMLDRVVEKMIALEKLIRSEKDNQKRRDEERKRRLEIRKSLDKYSSEGFKVTTVEQLLDENMNLLEEEFDIFIRQVARLKSLKEKLFKMDATGFEEEVSKLSDKLNDPENLDQVEKELDELKDSILSQRMRLQKLENALKEWSGMGFKVTKLEMALKKDIAEAEKVYTDYKARIEELSDYQTKLQDMGHKDIADQVHKITMMIKNPELLDTVRKEMARVQKTVTDIETIKAKRKELNELLKVWKTQGYRIDRILELMREESTYSGLEEIVLHYTRSIAALESFRAELVVEERGWFPQTESFIRENMNDPDRSQEILQRFDELKELNKKEEKRRGEIQRKLKELESRGIDISRIEPLLMGDSQYLTTEYEVFKENVKRLLKLKATLLKDAHRRSDQDLEMHAKSMNDPYSIDVYEQVQDGGKKQATGTQQAAATSTPVSQGQPDQLNPAQSVDQIKEAAKRLFRENNYEEALKLFELVLDVDPNQKESLFYRKKIMAKIRLPSVAPVAGQEGPSLVAPGISEASGPDAKEDGPQARTEVGKNTKLEGKTPNPHCLSCKGSGSCIWCQGSGKCSTCNGVGLSFGSTCTTCKGSGSCSVCKGTGVCSWCIS
ncbi:MAG: hypothetical protein MUC62_01760 [Candidatus Thermoplasmatota archaeon]|nr:hypothetical protein [Candidatus Thermoplasmatota archaeon]